MPSKAGTAVETKTTFETLLDLFHQSVDRFSDRVAFQREVGGGLRTFTYREVGRRAQGVAHQLLRLGIGQGERVGILSENRPEWGISFFGILLAGGIVVPLDIRLKTAEVENILKRSGARAVFAGEGGLKTLEEVRKGLPSLQHILSMQVPDFAPETAGPPQVQKPSPDDLAILAFSSGTTGQPKGVMLTHGNLASNVAAILSIAIHERRDVLLSVLPLHHLFECTGGFLAPFAKGCTVHYLDSITPRAISAALSERGITISPLVPALLRLFHKNIFSTIERSSALRRALFRSLFSVASFSQGLGLPLGRFLFPQIRRRFGRQFRFFVSGGAALEPAIHRDLKILGLEVLQGYGLTETSPITHVNRPGGSKIGTVGPPIPGVEVRFKPVDGAEAGEGEVLIRGPNVMKGYYEAPEMTAKVLKDGWFHTGDIGRIDEDGHLVICGRSKNVIVSEAGKNIYPEEVEEEILKSLYVKEVCVLGKKSPKGGEAVFAVVVPNEEVFKVKGVGGQEREVLEQEVKKASSRLADYKRVEDFVVVMEELPKTTTLKHKRLEIIDLLRQKGLWG